ncbi:MAG: signal peptidase I [Acidobacteriota bacterium]
MTLARLLHRIYAASLYCYPSEFRERFAPEMQQAFRDRYKEAFREPSLTRASRFYLLIAQDWIATFFTERLTTMPRTIFTVRRFALATAVTLLLLGVSTTAIQAFVIPTASMEGTLHIGDHLLVNKLARNPQRGDLVVFPYPEDPSQIFIKRVIGLPGDRIHIENKQIIRNGHRLIEPYALHSTTYIDPYRDNFPSQPTAVIPPSGQQMLKGVSGGEVTVPAGTLFVLGDNRDVSLDSRYWGFVPQTSVLGRPWLIYWSYDPSAAKTRWDRTGMRFPSPPAQEIQ